MLKDLLLSVRILWFMVFFLGCHGQVTKDFLSFQEILQSLFFLFCHKIYGSELKVMYTAFTNWFLSFIYGMAVSIKYPASSSVRSNERNIHSKETNFLY